jgi:hypothetical protein
MPLLGDALDGAVLAHRSDPQAIAGDETVDRERAEEKTHRGMLRE